MLEGKGKGEVKVRPRRHRPHPHPPRHESQIPTHLHLPREKVSSGLLHKRRLRLAKDTTTRGVVPRPMRVVLLESPTHYKRLTQFMIQWRLRTREYYSLINKKIIDVSLESMSAINLVLLCVVISLRARTNSIWNFLPIVQQ